MQERWVRAVGVGYVVAVFGLGLLNLLAGWGVRGVRVWLTPPGEAFNAPALSMLGWLGVAVLVVATVRRVPSQCQWWMVAAVAGWLGSTALSMTVHGVLDDSRYWSVAAIGVGVASAATLAAPADIRRLLLTLGWVFGWGSVAAGTSNAVFGWPKSVSGEERFAGWIQMLGIQVDSFQALAGLTSGRVYAGLTCGLLLVYTVRTLMNGDHPRWLWLSTPGMVITVFWSLSRTGFVIMVIGLLAALLPWERLRVGWLLAGVFTVILTPLVGSAWLARLDISDGTTAWRFDLWQDYLGKAQLWTPFGIGPQPFNLDYADHAHQQFLEALATGGWLGLIGVVTFVVLGSYAARSAAARDNRAAISVLFGMAVIFQLDVVTFAAAYRLVNNAFVIVVVVLVGAASLAARQPSPPHPRLLGKTPDPVDSQPKD
jgi:hypothetical protein